MLVFIDRTGRTILSLCDPAVAAGPPGDVFLPFEGDNAMSIILSKVFLLAEDTKIKDPAIVSQINRR